MIKNSFRFRYLEGSLQIEEMHQYECRGSNSIEILRRMAARSTELFLNATGTVAYNDWPPTLSAPLGGLLSFSATKLKGHPSPHLPFPCGYAIGWPQTGLNDADRLAHDLVADETPATVAKMFWIGGDTHPSRRTLVEWASKNSEICEAVMMHWNRETPSRLVGEPRYCSIWDHRIYKYLVDCPGHGYSARLKWLLATGRPVFVIDRQSVEHWHDFLVPWEHYVPVAGDLSDLLSAYEHLEDDPSLAALIGGNAKEFARQHLFLDRQIDATISSMRKM